MADEIALAVMLPGDRLPLSMLDPTRFLKPLVVLLGGDGITPDGSRDCGPEGWQQSRRLLRWSRWTLLHGTGGEEAHYDWAVEAARSYRRVLIAECGTATLPTWMALRAEVAPYCPGAVLQCDPDDFHPRRPAMAEGVTP
ncbi:hypothetical protein [Roseococcus suduntuyensis]|uniref:Uncharacterized protein n=2 Tax=Roseococcus suduntuyensis TaxID=455361 RepID=A0A840AIZ4_9PROT|nr:hypothetical protein [Roseococcus suduntuyensis]MBB3900104.1 hypothetical protein [Roseococcus suduntuyensis]